jgi:Fe-Mn family superoxide dismutase
MSTEDILRKSIRKSLGLPERTPGQNNKKKNLHESYVVEPKRFQLKTEFMSEKAKKARLDDFEQFVKSLNEVSAKLDTASREDADKYSSDFRALKVDEVHCLNAAFLRALHFENIDDPQSQLSMDSISFLRIERDFGSFDDWQKDFIACGMAARSGYVITAYNSFMKRYMNFVIDEEAKNVPIGTHPVIVLDVSEGAYYRDYVSDRKTYIIAMMKEFDWDQIETRVKSTEKIAKIK